jgi:hypothetical protein
MTSLTNADHRQLGLRPFVPAAVATRLTGSVMARSSELSTT